MTYVFIPCKYHHGRNVAKGPCTAKVDKEGNVCGWEPTDEERERILGKPRHKEDVVKVKGEPLKAPEEQVVLAPPEGETATMEVDPASELPGTIEEFTEPDVVVDEDPNGLNPPVDYSPVKPEGAPECWGCSGEPPGGAQCTTLGEPPCEFEESCLQAMLTSLAETGSVDGWCSIIDRKVELGGPCDATDPEMTCFNTCEYFQPLPEDQEEAGPPAQYEVYSPVPRRRYAVVDAETGEALQLSLLGAQWDEYRVKSERWSLSGGDETSQTEFENKIVYHDRELRPGTVVEVVCRGYVKERAPIFKKDVYEGKTVIVVESLVEIELLGYRGGPIEVALNVDGEPKVYDEAKGDTSS